MCVESLSLYLFPEYYLNSFDSKGLIAMGIILQT